MHRLSFGIKESSPDSVQQMVPPGFNGTNFSTLRWRYPTGLQNTTFNKASKCLVNLRKIRNTWFTPEEINVHRPVKNLCPVEHMRIENAESPLVAYHYAGSWEQWNFRRDFRVKRRREAYNQRYFEGFVDDTIRPWLQKFVAEHGEELSKELLKGAGLVEPRAKNAKFLG